MEDHEAAFIIGDLDKRVGLPSLAWETPWHELSKNVIHHWLHKTSSPLRLPPFEVVGHVKTGLNPQLNYADIQLYMFPMHLMDKHFADCINFNSEVTNAMKQIAKDISRDHIMIFANILHADTRGSITLDDSDPYGPPVIDMQYFKEPKDLDVVVAGLKRAVKLMQHQSLKPFGLSFDHPVAPACSHLKRLTDAHLRCVAEHATFTFYHPTSSCRMGPDSKDAVVDPRLRVYGVSRLRIADASIMPHNTCGNTNAPTMMIGEMAAKFIKEDHKEIFT